jgi:hypothetical protein
MDIQKRLFRPGAMVSPKDGNDGRAQAGKYPAKAPFEGVGLPGFKNQAEIWGFTNFAKRNRFHTL